MGYHTAQQQTLRKMFFFISICAVLLLITVLHVPKVGFSQGKNRVEKTFMCSFTSMCIPLTLRVAETLPLAETPSHESFGKISLPQIKCNSTEYWPEDCRNRCMIVGRDVKTAVPSIAHFIHIGGPLQFKHWLAVMASIKFIPAGRVHIYHYGNLTSCWSKKLQHNPIVHFLPINESHFPLKVGRWPLRDVAHKTDFVRLSALWEHGGVYLDFDAIPTKPLSPLLANEGVLSRQRDQDFGNGLIIARRHSCFVCEYVRAACRNYNGSWDAHSTLSLTEVFRHHKRSRTFEGMKLLNYSEGFFPFSWQKKFLIQLFETDRSNLTFQLTDVYALHMFASSVALRINVTLTWDWMMRSPSIVAAAMRNALPTFMKAHVTAPTQSVSPCPENVTTEV